MTAQESTPPPAVVPKWIVTTLSVFALVLALAFFSIAAFFQSRGLTDDTLAALAAALIGGIFLIASVTGIQTTRRGVDTETKKTIASRIPNGIIRLIALLLGSIAVIGGISELYVSFISGSQTRLLGRTAVFCFGLTAIGLFLVWYALKACVTRFGGVGRHIIFAIYPYAISALYVILLVIPVWIMLDACFHSSLVWARVDLGIPDEKGSILSSFPDSISTEDHQWSALGGRIIALLILAVAIPLLLTIAVARPIVGRPRKWPVVAIAFPLVGFVAVLHQYDNILWRAAQSRVKQAIPRFQTALDPLLAKWPTESGELPEAGKYVADIKRPDKLYLRELDSYARTESFGTFVNRLPDGGVSFSLEPHYLFVLEYHPAGHHPFAQHHSKYWIDTLQRSAMIGDGWYLTKYSSARK